MDSVTFSRFYRYSGYCMKQFILLSFCLSYGMVCGQASVKIDNILSQPRQKLEKLELIDSKTAIYLGCPFAQSGFDHITESQANSLTITDVYYVYTQYKQSETFNQLSLDRKRFNWLNTHFPFLLSDPLIQWHIVEQTGCNTSEEGDNYFHGFVIIHRPQPSAEERDQEITLLRSYLTNSADVFYDPGIDPIKSQLPVGIDTATKATNPESLNAKACFKEGEYALYEHFQQNLKNSENVSQQRLDKWVKVQFIVNEEGKIDSLIFLEDYPLAATDQIQNAFKIMPDWYSAKVNGKAVSSKVNMEIRISYSGEVKGMYTRDGIKPDFSADVAKIPIREETGTFNLMVNAEPIQISSTAVFKGLDKVRDFGMCALVMDVTGSMTLHIAAMTKWIKANHLALPFTSYTFFNDGDNKATKDKSLGKAGGVYITKVAGEIDDLITDTMRKGNGGEAAENDLEAVLFAIEHDTEVQAIVLIADNYSEVRDLSLLDKITKPVHVILCAAPKFVRPDYLQIAKTTGGLLMLNGETIDLSSVQKGDEIMLQGVKYKYDGKSFQPDYKGDIHY